MHDLRHLENPVAAAMRARTMAVTTSISLSRSSSALFAYRIELRRAGRFVPDQSRAELRPGPLHDPVAFGGTGERRATAAGRTRDPSARGAGSPGRSRRGLPPRSRSAAEPDLALTPNLFPPRAPASRAPCPSCGAVRRRAPPASPASPPPRHVRFQPLPRPVMPRANASAESPSSSCARAKASSLSTPFECPIRAAPPSP